MHNLSLMSRSLQTKSSGWPPEAASTPGAPCNSPASASWGPPQSRSSQALDHPKAKRKIKEYLSEEYYCAPTAHTGHTSGINERGTKHKAGTSAVTERAGSCPPTHVELYPQFTSPSRQNALPNAQLDVGPRGPPLACRLSSRAFGGAVTGSSLLAGSTVSTSQATRKPGSESFLRRQAAMEAGRAGGAVQQASCPGA